MLRCPNMHSQPPDQLTESDVPFLKPMISGLLDNFPTLSREELKSYLLHSLSQSIFSAFDTLIDQYIVKHHIDKYCLSAAAQPLNTDHEIYVHSLFRNKEGESGASSDRTQLMHSFQKDSVLTRNPPKNILMSLSKQEETSQLANFRKGQMVFTKNSERSNNDLKKYRNSKQRSPITVQSSEQDVGVMVVHRQNDQNFVKRIDYRILEELSSRDGGNKVVHESPLILPEFYDNNDYDQRVFQNLLLKTEEENTKLYSLEQNLRDDNCDNLRVVNISRLIMENTGNATPPSSISQHSPFVMLSAQKQSEGILISGFFDKQQKGFKLEKCATNNRQKPLKDMKTIGPLSKLQKQKQDQSTEQLCKQLKQLQGGSSFAGTLVIPSAVDSMKNSTIAFATPKPKCLMPITAMFQFQPQVAPPPLMVIPNNHSGSKLEVEECSNISDIMNENQRGVENSAKVEKKPKTLKITIQGVAQSRNFAKEASKTTMQSKLKVSQSKSTVQKTLAPYSQKTFQSLKHSLQPRVQPLTHQILLPLHIKSKKSSLQPTQPPTQGIQGQDQHLLSDKQKTETFINEIKSILEGIQSHKSSTKQSIGNSPMHSKGKKSLQLIQALTGWYYSGDPYFLIGPLSYLFIFNCSQRHFQELNPRSWFSKSYSNSIQSKNLHYSLDDYISQCP